MTLLLDTNVILLADRDPERLGAILDRMRSSELVWSPVATWEIAIKASLGKLPLRATPTDYVEGARRALGGRWLPISSRHTGAVFDLPPEHGDPFDRLLVATAQVEGLTLATTDRTLARYDIDVLLP